MQFGLLTTIFFPNMESICYTKKRGEPLWVHKVVVWVRMVVRKGWVVITSVVGGGDGECVKKFGKI